MTQFLKPSNLNNVWASGGDRIYPGDTKYATGWQVEIPPRQYFNEIDYKQDQMLAHLNQHGIAVWDNETEYQADKSYVQGSTSGAIYRCTLTHGGNPGAAQDPELDTSNTYWEVAFASAGEFYTQTESDARYAQISNNGSEYSPAAFRNTISVYSKAETYTKAEVDSRTTVASALQAQTQTSNTVLLTPQRLGDSFGGANQSLTQNGFQKLPGGLTLQWGVATVSVSGTGGTTVITLPTAYTASCFMVVGNLLSSTQVNDNLVVNTSVVSTSQIRLTLDSAGTATPPQGNQQVYWFSLGV